MTPKSVADDRPGPTARLVAGTSVVLISCVWLLPIAAVVSTAVFLVGIGDTDLPTSRPALEGRALAIVLIGSTHVAFVACVFALRALLNLGSAKKTSPFLWAFGAWALTAFSEVRVTEAFADAVGAKTGLVLWLSTGFALFALWVALLVARFMWWWAMTSRTGATTVALAGVGFVLLPAATISSVSHSPANTTPVASSSSGVFGTSNVGGDSPYDECLARLQGPTCNDVWGRANRTFGGDEVQQAFIYVCIERQLTPQRLCGSFWKKAESLSRDALRYSRRFKNPDLVMPHCPVAREDDVFTQEELDHLDAAKARLDARQQFILNSAYADDQTDREIAEKVQLSTVRVRVLRRAAENQLKQNLESCR